MFALIQEAVLSPLVEGLFPAAWHDGALQVAMMLLKITLLLIPLLMAVAYITYAERRIIGSMQCRIGPNRVGWFGLLQPIADMVKLLCKEVVIPSSSNRFLFLVAPMFALAPSLAAWAVVPLFETGYLADIEVGVLYVLALTSLSVYGVIIAGWASNSKYSLLGALRSTAQMISYEIPVGFCVVCVVLAAGSMNLREIVLAQSGSIFHWYLLPLLPVAVIYFISCVAETNRAPFDVAEGESEIVAGFHVEYSGIMFSSFFLAEYANMILLSMMSAVLFCGGWLSPLQGLPLGWLATSSIFWLLAKCSFFLFLFIWLRATFPRYRYDQIMRLGWKVFLPVVLIWIVLVSLLVVLKMPPWFD